VFAPVIVWNSQHEWASFAFQTSRRLAEPPKFALHRLIGSILVLITPTAAVAAVLAVASGPRAADATVDHARRRRLLLLATLVPLSVFVVFSLRHEVKLDWTGALWTAALPLLGCGMTTLASGRDLRSRVQAAWAPTLVVLVLIYATGLQYLVSGLPGLGYSRYLNDLPVAWRDLSRSVGAAAAAYSRESHNEVLIVGMDRYAIASELAARSSRIRRWRHPTATCSRVWVSCTAVGHRRICRNIGICCWSPGIRAIFRAGMSRRMRSAWDPSKAVC
jgi:dolichol-phosphate mannosyltransferase